MRLHARAGFHHVCRGIGDDRIVEVEVDGGRVPEYIAYFDSVAGFDAVTDEALAAEEVGGC